MARIRRQDNPILKAKLWWVWIFLLPFAFLLWMFFEIRENRRIDRIKRERRDAKKRRKQEEFMRKHWEYDFWFDDQGL